MEEKFTIIISSYNYENYIKETIESVINQTYTNWEMVIVDDGSTDNSVEVIKSYCQKDDRIKLFQHENGVNKGIVETVKLGISKANTEWIVFIESDDIITPNYLEKKYEIIKKNKDVNYIFNQTELFGDKNAVEAFYPVIEKQLNILAGKSIVTIEDLKDLNVVLTFSAVMMKKSLFEGVDFCSPIRQLLDYYLWLQIASKTNLYYIDEVLTKWRMHPNSYNTHKVDENLVIDFDIAKYGCFHPKLPKWLIHVIFIPRYIKYARRKFIKISLREKSVTIFGKKFTKNSP